MKGGPALLLAAFPPELAGLDVHPPPGWVTACTGVGAVVAAVATARLLAVHQPDQVLFVGTCGAYGPDLATGTLVWAAEALAVTLDEVEGRAFRPRVEQTRWPATLAPPLPFPAQVVAVTPGVTCTAEGAARLSALAGVEHLELTGVFAACHAASVPCGAVLGVATRVGPGAHGEWREHHLRVSAELRAALERLGVFGPR